MKFLISLLALLMLATPTLADDINVSFIYEGPATSFNMYMDDTVYCKFKIEELEDGNDGRLLASCSREEIPIGWHDFSLTAVVADGRESSHSNSVSWRKSRPKDTLPTLFEVIITVNGKEYR